MNMKDIELEILNKTNRSDSLGKDFTISAGSFQAEEFCQIDLHSLDQKENSFTVLILPMLKDNTNIIKLFGDNSKEGGESSG